MKKGLLLIFFLLVISCAYSQPSRGVGMKDTTGIGGADSASTKINVPTVIHFTTPETAVNGLLIYNSLDTLLDDIQIEKPATRYFYNDLSNIGSASDPRIFKVSPQILTYFGNTSFDLYKWRPEDIRYFKTNKNYSEITYHQGGGKEQDIKFTLAENITKNWNTGIDFRRMGSLGFLNRGTIAQTNFDAFTWLHSIDNRYQLFASAIWNSFKNEVNGGIVSDSLVNASDFSNAEMEGVSVRLNNAHQRVRNHIFSLNHFYDFGGRKKSDPDSTIYLPTFRIRHDMSYESANYAYFDTLAGNLLYKDYFFEPVTHDSLHYSDLKNKISFTNFINLDEGSVIKNINYELGAGYQFFEYKLVNDSSFINTLSKYGNVFAEGRVNTLSKDKKLKLSGGVQSVVSGDNNGSYSYDASARIPVIDSAFVEVGAVKSGSAPSLFQKFYLSNHFMWASNFSDVQSTILKAEIQFPKYFFRIGIQQNMMKNFIYFNSSAYPEQSNGSVNVSQIFIRKDFHFWNFRLNNFICVQKSDQKQIHVPNTLSHNTLLYEYGFFKKKLLTQIGLDLHYTSSYYSNDYSPATSVFYLQDSIKTNGYPLVDFFVNFKIKRARIFLKLANLSDILSTKVYYETPHYPRPGLTFQFGVNWRFFD